jgi:hypothetical protein
MTGEATHTLGAEHSDFELGFGMPGGRSIGKMTPFAFLLFENTYCIWQYVRRFLCVVRTVEFWGKGSFTIRLCIIDS